MTWNAVLSVSKGLEHLILSDKPLDNGRWIDGVLNELGPTCCRWCKFLERPEGRTAQHLAPAPEQVMIRLVWVIVILDDEENYIGHWSLMIETMMMIRLVWMIVIINDGNVEIGLDDDNSNGHLRKLHSWFSGGSSQLVLFHLRGVFLYKFDNGWAFVEW